MHGTEFPAEEPSGSVHVRCREHGRKTERMIFQLRLGSRMYLVGAKPAPTTRSFFTWAHRHPQPVKSFPKTTHGAQTANGFRRRQGRSIGHWWVNCPSAPSFTLPYPGFSTVRYIFFLGSVINFSFSVSWSRGDRYIVLLLWRLLCNEESWLIPTSRVSSLPRLVREGRSRE